MPRRAEADPGACYTDAMTRTKKVGPLTIAYDDRVLEPRPWTAAQAEWAAELSAGLPDGPLVELCSGAGHIGLLASVLTGREAVLVDASAAACELARVNAGAAGVTARVEVRLGDLTTVLGDDERFPLVLADPPYIPTAGVDRFPEDPVRAIDGGADGLAVARTCLAVAARHVTGGGAVLIQLRDAEQADRLGREATGLVLEEVREVDGRGALAHLVPRT